MRFSIQLGFTMVLLGCGGAPSTPASGSTLPLAAAEPPAAVPAEPAEVAPDVPRPSSEVTLEQDASTSTEHGVVIVLHQAFASYDDGGDYIELTLKHGDHAFRTELPQSPDRERALTWCGVSLSLLDVHEAETSTARVSLEGTYALPPKVRLNKGDPTELFAGTRITLTGHGHKRVMAGGPPSPLLIYYEAQGPHDTSPTVHEARVEPGEQPTFYMADRLVELVAHGYDAWMEVRVVD